MVTKDEFVERVRRRIVTRRRALTDARWSRAEIRLLARIERQLPALLDIFERRSRG